MASCDVEWMTVTKGVIAAVQVHMSNGNISLWELPADLSQPMPKDPVKSCATPRDAFGAFAVQPPYQ